MKNLRISTRNTSKIMKKIFDLTGFEPGTFQLWGLHAGKKPWRLVVMERDFLWYSKSPDSTNSISTKFGLVRIANRTTASPRIVRNSTICNSY